MRTKKQLRSISMDAEKVKTFFSKLSATVTSGCEKVWIIEERNGEVSFLIGKERIRLSESAIKKGGLL